MKKIGYKLIHVLLLSFLFCLLILGASSVSAQETNLISTRSDFINAINSANDGDTILVGDIDFNLPSSGAVNVIERIEIEKSITIKSGKNDSSSVFKGASFILNGTMIANSNTTFVFEGIVFDEGLDTSTLTYEDWQLFYDSQGAPVSNDPIKNQYAIELNGNANATFINCKFKSYMYAYGPAIRAIYSDDASCILSVTLEKCDFENNAALYGGGAIYLEGKSKNVTLNVSDCTFKANKSGFMQNSVGGGAIYIRDTAATILNSCFLENDANYYYGGEKISYDQTNGGAIYCSSKCDLTITNSIIAKNKASRGGGVAVVESSASVENCIIAENSAIASTDDKMSEYGISSERGLGGAIYLNAVIKLTIINCEIYKNYAENVFGAIFANYDLMGDYSTNLVEIVLCTIVENSCKTQMSEYMSYGQDAWLWFSYPGDFFDISYVKAYGNLIVDSVYDAYIQKTVLPSEESNYNYIVSTKQAKEDGYILALPEGAYEHIRLKNAPEVPAEFAEERLRGRNYYGAFTIGANTDDITFKLFVDGECKEEKKYSSGKMPILPNYEKAGYTLTSWSLDEGLDYCQDKPIIVGNATDSVNFYASFTPNKYKVSFDFGNDTVEVEQVYNTPLVFPDVREKENHTFKGWFTEKDGMGSALNEGDAFENVGDITYYAFYEKNFPTLTVVMISVAVLFACILTALAIVIIKHKHKAVAVSEKPNNENVKENTDISKLSPREKEVLHLLLEGKQRNEIATNLYISENTVKKQISSIYQKLGVNSRSELFAMFK